MLYFKKTKQFLKFSALSILLSQLQGCSDSATELSGNYFFVDEGGENKIILSHSPNRSDIFGTVINYKFNDDFIVVLQKPSFKDYISHVGFELRNDLSKYPTNSKDEIKQSEIIADSLLRNNAFYKSIFSRTLNYWIIVHKEDKVLGPFSKSEYVNARKELAIPDEINFEE